MFHITAIHVCAFMFGYTSAFFTQPEIVLLRSKKTARIECLIEDSFKETLHWYRQKKGGDFQRLLYITSVSGKSERDNSIPSRFSASRTNEKSTLTIATVDQGDEAIYYCAGWKVEGSEAYKIFGSGTELIVSDKSPKEPKLFAFTPSKPQNQKVTLLCLATDMFPNVVRFKWKRDGKELPGADFEQLDQREDKQTSSMIIIDEAREKDKYSCSVEYETKKEKQPVEIEIPNTFPAEKPAEASNPEPDPSCVPLNTNGTGETQVTMANFGVTRSLYLGTLIYSLLLAKSVMYFGIVSILICKWPGGPVKGRKLP